jgi:hypothetical protein
MNDRVNKFGGGHYRRLEPQPWDVVHAWGLDFFLGNVVKCVARAGRKGDPVEDLKKAKHYLEKKITLLRMAQEPSSGPRSADE